MYSPISQALTFENVFSYMPGTMEKFTMAVLPKIHEPRARAEHKDLESAIVVRRWKVYIHRERERERER
jgi:hypothetical protein